MGKDQGIYIYPHDLAVLSRRLEAFKFDSVDCCYSCIHLRGGGGVGAGSGVHRIMAYTGRLRPKGLPFSGFRYMKGYNQAPLGMRLERVGISLVEVYEMVGKSVILVSKKAQKD